ncbi:hypothetical protein BKA64DRAFT_677031 [Cadophora sp. MPI-SDFR-AT-0126]|nr:hypothetical protein BKA64DRAFT_689927 [Leotiomycetes sp. MPI-SDFR-AT-0126]KAH7391188.1 hypothetical protein BKA64DRAFT_677031 [Leotiomycetes sp. MPI-SDFR-AT-0126]
MTSNFKTQDSPTSACAPSSPSRRPYKGSCHCGYTQYIAYLTLPPPIIHAKPESRSSTIRIRKCNCTTCHKMSFFHVRLMSSPDDFLLLSPVDPFKDLSDYTCFEAQIHWFFCGKCGVRCFSFIGEGEVRDAEIEGLGTRNVWTPKKEDWVEGGGSYLSVNAATLDAEQEGLDLREWTEKGWIAYLDIKDEVGEDRLGSPHPGGMY